MRKKKKRIGKLNISNIMEFLNSVLFSGKMKINAKSSNTENILMTKLIPDKKMNIITVSSSIFSTINSIIKIPINQFAQKYCNAILLYLNSFITFKFEYCNFRTDHINFCFSFPRKGFRKFKQRVRSIPSPILKE